MVTAENTMLSIAFLNDWKLENGLLSGTAIINKTNTYDSFFDTEILSVVLLILDPGTGKQLARATENIILGFASQVEKFISIPFSGETVKAGLIVGHTSTGRDMSLIPTKTFSESISPQPTGFSFNINAVNPSYIENRVQIGLKYFIAGSGRCSEGQCGGETMQFFMQVKDANTKVVIELFKQIIPLPNAFQDIIDFDEIISPAPEEILVELFMWDLNNMPMSDTFPFFLTKESPPEPEPEPEPEPDPDPNTNMLLVTSQNFKIENNRVLGSVAIVATSSFDPFFNDLPLTLFAQIKSPDGTVLVLKPNSIFFNDTVREQNINIDESAFDETKVTVELFVWDSLTRAFSNVVSFVIEAEEVFPDPNSFQQDFTIVEYKSTQLGKSLFAQIQVSKLVDPPENLINSFLQVLTEGRKVVNLENQEINVVGVNQFSIVYDIPDLNQPTAKIFVQHFLQTKGGIALSDVIEVTRTIDISVEPVPKAGDNFFSKIVGIWAGMTAGALMLSRRGN